MLILTVVPPLDLSLKDRFLFSSIGQFTAACLTLQWYTAMQIAAYSSVNINKYIPSVPNIALNALHVLYILILPTTLGGGILLLLTLL